MSKKSRTRTEARWANKQTIDCLDLQKAQIHESVAEQFAYAIVWAVVTVAISVCFIIYDIQVPDLRTFLILITLIPGGITVLCFVGAVRRQRIARLFDGISYAMF